MSTTTSMPATSPPQATDIQRRGMRSAIISQCFYAWSVTAFANGILLLYLDALGISSSRIVLYLSLLPFVTSAFLIPNAFLADRLGKKLVGYWGVACTIIGFFVVTLAGFLPGQWPEAAVVAGISVFAAGESMIAAGWFALLSPIIPEHLRGSFFGKLRFSWQLASIVFAGVVALYVSQQSPVWAFQIVMGLITVGVIVRVPFYARIPELERPDRSGYSFRASLRNVLDHSEFISFCAYVFLLKLATAGCPVLFGLVEKRVLGYSDGLVVWMGSLMMVGSVIGFGVAGRLVDRIGTRTVFLVCHFGFAIAIFAFLGRSLWPAATDVTVGLVNFMFGLLAASSSIAVSAEMLGLIPPQDKSLSTSLVSTLNTGGAGVAGVMASAALSVGMLADDWAIGSQAMSPYDAILLVFGVSVLLLVVTLGLVPSVIGRAGWVPQQG